MQWSWQYGAFQGVSASPDVQVVVPDHKELDRGTLRAVLRQASLTIEQFIDSL
jgi:hypothetical protein